MRKFWLFLSAALLAGCGTVVNSMNCLMETGGSTFDGAQLCQTNTETPAAAKTPPAAAGIASRRIGRILLPPGVPDGPYAIESSNGRLLKTIVKNGAASEFADVYYPNGQLHSHTPLTDGLPDGLSLGYTETGVLTSRVWYRQGEIIRTESIPQP